MYSITCDINRCIIWTNLSRVWWGRVGGGFSGWYRKGLPELVVYEMTLAFCRKTRQRTIQGHKKIFGKS